MTLFKGNRIDDRDKAPTFGAEITFAEPEVGQDAPDAPPDEPPAEAPPEPTPPPAPPRVYSVALRASPGRLLVATNPWAAIDHKGRPAGACPAEVGPRDENARTYVGARPAFGDITRPAPRRAELYQRTERRDLVWEFQREPFEVPDTSYYRRKVRERELLDATKDYEAARALLSARHKDAAPPRWI
jgi:hypothetical protein